MLKSRNFFPSGMLFIVLLKFLHTFLILKSKARNCSGFLLLHAWIEEFAHILVYEKRRRWRRYFTFRDFSERVVATLIIIILDNSAAWNTCRNIQLSYDTHYHEDKNVTFMLISCF